MADLKEVGAKHCAWLTWYIYKVMDVVDDPSDKTANDVGISNKPAAQCVYVF